jgi:hypothetical protein
LFLNPGNSVLQYILWMGPISVIPSLILGFVILAIVGEKQGPQFEGDPLVLFFGVLFCSPVLETLLMVPILWLISLVVRPPIVIALTSAFIWAVLHSLAAPAWGFVIFWPFFVFSCAYLAWRKRSWWLAIAVTTTLHMFQNVLPSLALLLIG